MRRQEVAMLCPAGLETVVAAAASAELSKFHLTAEGPGYLRGMANASTTELRAFPCATNVFNVVAGCRRSTPEEETLHLTGIVSKHKRPGGLPARGTFRLRIHDDGQFASTGGGEAVDLERAIAQWSGFTLEPRGAQIEFWMIRRREQPETVLATKLTGGNPPQDAGTLRPEICAALARLGRLKHADLALDPFAGSGAIGVACAAAGARRVWVNDHDESVLRADAMDREAMERMRVTHLDLEALDELIPDGSVSSVVTDPPWGNHDDGLGPEGAVALHARLGEAARRWLHYDGTLVLLSGADQRAIDGLLAAGPFDVHLELPILVNGHKAKVLQLMPGRRR